mmetsp:Transcript_27351/g.66413  ORF Transcript_27351/g.66413 Transcript_27351/m.66413 type:complete len:203 (+) Transcript_27351:335-943(+)
MNHICHVLDKGFVRVQRWAASPVDDSGFFSKFSVLQINFFQCLNVLADKANWDNHQVGNSLLAKFWKNIISVWSEPFDGSYSGLITQMDLKILLRVGLVQLISNLFDTLLNLTFVRIPCINVGLRNSVCRKKDMLSLQVRASLFGIRNLLFSESIQFRLDQITDCFDISRSIVPTWNHSVNHITVLCSTCGKLLLQNSKRTP